MMNFVSSLLMRLSLVVTLQLMTIDASLILGGPNDTIANQGDSIVLICRVNVSINQAVTWKSGNPKEYVSHNRQIIREEKVDRYSIVGNETSGEYNLLIMPVLPEDNGEYSCSVLRDSSEDVASAILTVLYPPSNSYPVCSSVENTLQFNEIETLAIVCKTGISDPPAKISWRDTNGQVINETGIELIGNEYVVSHKEVIYDYHDSATFTCSVSHPLWSEPKNCSLGPLYILYHPRTTVSVRMTDTDVILTCIATGNPSKFSYEWTVFLGNQSAPHIDFKKQNITNTTDTLLLDRTDYYSVELVVECAARNSQGVGRTNATILLTSSHCRGGKTKMIDICRTISLPTIFVLVILICICGLAIALLIVKVRKLKKMTATEVKNVSSRVEMKRKENNGVYVTLTESIDNLERI